MRQNTFRAALLGASIIVALVSGSTTILAAQFRPVPYGYPGVFDRDADVRVEVTPKQTEVFVDGYYAGIADDYDGYLQRLHVPAGEHEIELYLKGYRTVRQKLYLPARRTYKLRQKMEPLAAGESEEPRPVPIAPPADSSYPLRTGPMPPRGRPGPPPPPTQPAPPTPPAPMAGASVDSRFGTLAIRVQPADADVLIDGERWRGPEGDERLIVQLAEGTHRVEIQKRGYERFSGDVHVQRGQTTPLNVSLPPGREYEN